MVFYSKNKRKRNKILTEVLMTHPCFRNEHVVPWERWAPYRHSLGNEFSSFLWSVGEASLQTKLLIVWSKICHRANPCIGHQCDSWPESSESWPNQEEFTNSCFPTEHSFSVSLSVYVCLRLYPTVSLSVPVCPFLSARISVRPWLPVSLSVPVY